MTFLEKWKEDMDIASLAELGCPSHYGYEDKRGKECDGKCVECWDREMQNTEFKQKVVNTPSQETLDFIHENIETIPQTEVESHQKGYENGYANGLEDGRNEVWELAKKCVHLEGCGEDNELMYKIFNTVFIKQLFDDNTPQEALAKLKAYEESQKLKVGDIVKNVVLSEVFVGVVSNIEYNEITVMWDDGTSGLIKRNELEKTGKHIDIQSILEQIGE